MLRKYTHIHLKNITLLLSRSVSKQNHSTRVQKGGLFLAICGRHFEYLSSLCYCHDSDEFNENLYIKNGTAVWAILYVQQLYILSKTITLLLTHYGKNNHSINHLTGKSTAVLFFLTTLSQVWVDTRQGI